MQHKSDILLDHSKKLLEEVKSSQKQTNNNKDTTVPPNATIKSEYVNCGKEYCNRCKHGPYYYAYWKVGSKLKKKYLGKEIP